MIKKHAGLGDPDLEEIAKGEKEFHQFAAVLNDHLKGRTWLVGDDLTNADFSVGVPMTISEAAQYPLAAYPEITRWYAALAALPAWKQAVVPSPR